MADLAWTPARDCRDPDRLTTLVTSVCDPLTAGRVRPLIAVRRTGKTWALRAIAHARRVEHPRFIDLRIPALPVVEASTSLLLLDEPAWWLVTPERAAELDAWFGRIPGSCHIVLAMTPAELAELRTHYPVACGERDVIALPTPCRTELVRAASGHDLAAIPWRWRSSFYLLRTWLEARAEVPGASSRKVADVASRKLLLNGGDVHLSAVFGESLPPDLREALQQVGRGNDPPLGPRDELIKLGLVTASGDDLHNGHPDDGPWHIADPVVAAALTPLRVHHLSDIHIGHLAATTVDAKHDPTTDRRLTEALGDTFVRDEYLTELDHLIRRGLGPHLVVISGDLVERASDPPLLVEARRWVDQVRDRVRHSEHPCLHDDDPRVLVVGGNHDVDWKAASDPDPCARHRPFAEAFKDVPHPRLELPLATRPCEPVLYRGAGLALWLLGSAELGGEQLSDPRLRAVFDVVDGLPAGDATRAALEPHRSAPERIDPGLVAQQVLDAPAPPASARVRIAVVHHPVTALAGTAPEVASFTGLINAATVKAALRHKGYQLVLHGHVHHGALVCETDYSDKATLHIAAAPTLGSKETQEQRGYNAISIERALPRPGCVPNVAVRVERVTHRGKGAGWQPDGAVMTFEVPG